jgi:hypothetical protein
MTIAVRHPAADEFAAAAEVLNAHSRALHGTDDTTAEELEEVWRAPEVEFPADVFVAERDAALVGYGDVIPFGESAWVDVRATEPAAYEPLLDAVVRRAEEHSRAHIRTFAADADSDARARG